MTNEWFILMGFGADRPQQLAMPSTQDWEKADWILARLLNYSTGHVETSGSHARDRETIARALAADRELSARAL